jgi:hypothetical protein
MAITTPEKRLKHIRGLVEAAKQIQREERNREDKNFTTVMRWFREKAETRKGSR